MDIASNLEYNFLEQCFLQIDRLRNELIDEEARKKDGSRSHSHRLFRFNVFEDVSPDRIEYFKRKLTYALKALGVHINNNLIAASRSRNSPTPGTKSSHDHCLLVPDRGRISSNYYYDSQGVIHLKPKNEVKFKAMKPQYQGRILHVVAKVVKLIETRGYLTKRELYYLSLDFCRVIVKRRPPLHLTQPSSNGGTQPSSQSNRLSQLTNSQSEATVVKFKPEKLDEALDDLCCLMGCSKVHLHIIPQSKGLVYGNLKFKLKTGEVFDCQLRQEAIMLPGPKAPIIEIESDAKFIIVLEKDSIMQKIISQEQSTDFVKNYKVILLTGKGYPDITTRAFLNYLWSKLKIPILALTDADPHGLEIVCSYKFGCYNTAYEGLYLAVPQVRWLGLLPTDVKRLALPESTTLPLSIYDRKKITSLLKRPYLRNRESWVSQLNEMTELGRKAELESLVTDGEYLVRTYLPNKLRYASWL